MIWDVIIIGAGAAGLMAAAVAGKAGARVLLTDHADKPGKKILISGGGRCNFTNLETAPQCYISENPHFMKSALSRYTQWDFLDLVSRYNIAWHEKTLGQLFCDGSARQILDMLLTECERAGVTLKLSRPAGEVSHADGIFTAAGAKARKLIIATGGPSIPKMGATGVAYEIAAKFGLDVVTPKPALVPLTLGPEEALFKEISGVACPVIASAGGMSFPEAALFTHKGLSGPAILQISSYWRPGEPVSLNLLPGAETLLKTAKQKTPRAHLKAALNEHLPSRLADVLAAKIGYEAQLANISDADLTAAAERLSAFTFRPNGTEGFAKAEVTAGGVSTAELSSKTMELRKVPGLYFIGEAVDVTGWLGGYNFQWAWSSGYAAGVSV